MDDLTDWVQVLHCITRFSWGRERSVRDRIVLIDAVAIISFFDNANHMPTPANAVTGCRSHAQSRPSQSRTQCRPSQARTQSTPASEGLRTCESRNYDGLQTPARRAHNELASSSSSNTAIKQSLLLTIHVYFALSCLNIACCCCQQMVRVCCFQNAHTTTTTTTATTTTHTHTHTHTAGTCHHNCHNEQPPHQLPHPPHVTTT
jgi:hypothetical protein